MSPLEYIFGARTTTSSISCAFSSTIISLCCDLLSHITLVGVIFNPETLIHTLSTGALNDNVKEPSVPLKQEANTLYFCSTRET